ncbi:hypothetical protein [Bremerella cremea]|uniref:hypothetical protein n=1 Tax=Bremerella cremea TaxID=1031537 RepID=UPI0031EC2B25
MRSSSPNYSPIWRVAALALCCLLVAYSPAQADDADKPASAAPVETGYWVANEHELADLNVELGIAGHFKLGSWTEVRLSVAAEPFAEDPTLAVIALDSDGVPTEVIAPAPQRTGDQLNYRIPVKIGRRSSNLQIEFISGEGSSQKTTIREVPISQLATPILASDNIFLQFGPDFGLRDAVQRYASQLSGATTIVPVTRFEELPDQWYMLEGIDQIFWIANDPNITTAITPSQFAAIDMWLKQGGNMTLSVGTGAEELIAADKPLAAFVPGTFRSRYDLRSSTEMEAMVNGVSRVDRPVEKPLPISIIENPRGKVRIQEGSRQLSYPLWIQNANGFGMVNFFAFDLSAEPMAKWPGREPLLKLLLDSVSDRLEESKVNMQGGTSVAHYGYTDIAGQLRLALDQFPGVRNVSFFLVGAIIVVYLALIGPGDYFFLRRFGLRMEWTWVTFPALILLACVGIWSMATWSKGTSLKLNQVNILDIDLESKLVRSTTWFHLFSPASKRYELNLAPTSVPSSDWNQLVSWQGLAGSGLGGMSARRSISTVPTPYDIDFQTDAGNTQVSLDGLPIQVWSSKTLAARGWGKLNPVEYEPLQERESQLVEGVITNPTDMDLTDCYLFHGRWAFFIARLPAGGTARIVPGQAVQNTEKVLKRRRVQESTDGGENWDRQSTDVPRIMELIMFHSAAGGRSYTNLSNRVQGYVDLSSHIEGDRAVLVGKVETPPIDVQIDGQTVDPSESQSWSYVRIVVPVQKRSSSEKIAQQ